VTVVSLIANPQVFVLLETEDNVVADTNIGSGTTNINLSGSDQASLYIGTGDDQLQVLIGSADPTANASLIASNGPLNGVVAYTYTLPTLAIPETPTWAAMLIGFASLGFAARATCKPKGSGPTPSSALRRTTSLRSVFSGTCNVFGPSFSRKDPPPPRAEVPSSSDAVLHWS
jgi:hypothetical protein